MPHPIESRVRSSFDLLPVPYGVSYNGAVQPTNFHDQRWMHYHYMVDQVNPYNRNTGHRNAGFCQHLKVDKSVVANSVTWRAPDGTMVTEVNPEPYFSAGLYHEFTLGHTMTAQTGGQSPTGSVDVNDKGYSNMIGDFASSASIANLDLNAWNKFKTQIPSATSLANFIFELKDFKDVIVPLKKIPKAIRSDNVTGLLSGSAKNKRRVPLKAGKAVNDAYLNFSLNWLPFVGDIITFTQTVDRVAKKLNFLRQTRGKEVTLRYSIPDCNHNPLQGQIVHEITVGNPAWHMRWYLSSYNCNYVATCKLKQNLQDLDDAWAGLRGTIADLGLNNPAKIVWNAIPFSFIVDYVAPFGKWLESAAVQPFSGQWDVYDVTRSVHEVGVVSLEVTPPGNGTFIMNQVTVDKYLRLAGLPVTLGSVDFSQLTENQQKLLLSLGLAQVL